MEISKFHVRFLYDDVEINRFKFYWNNELLLFYTDPFKSIGFGFKYRYVGLVNLAMKDNEEKKIKAGNFYRRSFSISLTICKNIGFPFFKFEKTIVYKKV